MKLKQFFTLSLLLPIFLVSQELDEDFLNSLPPDIRQDIEEKIESKESVEKPVYRRASTSIDKKIEDEEYKLFGSKFFDTMQSSFMPINEPNLDPSYILDFGDALEIQLVGQLDSISTYSIQRDGSINLPEIGKIILSGLSLADASALIKAKVNNVYIGTQTFISLKNIRDINILIAGNAYNPGIYTLNGNSNMLHALHMAGGINDIGSYRSIDLVRNGEIVSSLDLYDVLIYGKYNFSKGLRSGDSIVINPVEKLISIESGVLRPGTYELLDNESITNLIDYANGYSKNADLNDIIIKRLNNGISTVINIDIDELRDFDLNNNDSIFIKEFKVNTVEIKGAVKNQGTYKLAPGTTITDLIMIAGGYEKNAYPFGGYLENKKALEINENAKKKLYDTFITNLVINGGVSTAESGEISLLLKQIKDAESTGRVIAEFDLDVIAQDPSKDTILEDGDTILIPNITQQVYIQGDVSNPGAIRYNSGMDLNYYIKKSGGLLGSADKESIFIVNPNGETQITTSSNSLSFVIDNRDKQLIYPGSIIYVPKKSDFSTSIQVASIWAPILSSIALSITSLSVLNNN